MSHLAKLQFPHLANKNKNTNFRRCKWRLVIIILVLHTQLGPILCNPMDCSPSGSSIHGILQVRILEWVAIPFCRGSSRSRDWTQVARIAGRLFTIWVTIYKYKYDLCESALIQLITRLSIITTISLRNGNKTLRNTGSSTLKACHMEWPWGGFVCWSDGAFN